MTNDPFSAMEDNLFQHYLELNIKLKRKIKYSNLNQLSDFMSCFQKLSCTQMSPKYSLGKNLFSSA